MGMKSFDLSFENAQILETEDQDQPDNLGYLENVRTCICMCTF